MTEAGACPAHPHLMVVVLLRLQPDPPAWAALPGGAWATGRLQNVSPQGPTAYGGHSTPRARARPHRRHRSHVSTTCGSRAAAGACSRGQRPLRPRGPGAGQSRHGQKPQEAVGTHAPRAPSLQDCFCSTKSSRPASFCASSPTKPCVGIFATSFARRRGETSQAAGALLCPCAAGALALSHSAPRSCVYKGCCPPAAPHNHACHTAGLTLLARAALLRPLHRCRQSSGAAAST